MLPSILTMYHIITRSQVPRRKGPSLAGTVSLSKSPKREKSQVFMIANRAEDRGEYVA